ncbi:MAG: AMP-binding protein [Pseudomonadota bacterium]|uniref:Acyl-CoA synthetase n=1 Tax=marine metagenome TaxID=408172 RepID=A0A381PB97_9ZZZZ|nr:acyl-CoA synthetase [Gammaproteobacteria bacterium]MEC9285501.1 AMP-binding protein [Pseudomonadota bacterium]HBP15166.1 acyl-CoA synthetase [Gammaproteobacteria bacterium]HCP49772.1 acyl-CoA synthetase [Gammaproteobacteria bacterium]|tara:strand:+ start:250 stop:1803 length:1554 start_codon:yes stop_codon:yes gene_type:complete
MYPGHWATIFPDKPAAIDTANGETVTYRELNDRSNRLAQLMWDRGLRQGDHVSIFMENNLAYFEVLWAALRSGLYFTSVNRYLTTEEAGYIIDNSESQALITSIGVAEVAEGLAAFAPNCQTWLCVGGSLEGYEDYEDGINSHPAQPLEQEPAGTFMLYSSGTTGRPKGILRPLPEGLISSADNLVGGLLGGLWQFDENVVYLSPAPLYHSAPLSFSSGTQALGGTVVMMHRFDPIQALQAIEDYQVTHSQWVPTMFTRMLKLPEADRSGFDLSSHKVAIHAAAPCPPDVKRQMFDWWGPIVYEYYGGTELNGFTHCGPEEWLAHPGTVGRSLLGTIHICDEDGTELPNGEQGIVYFEMETMPFEYLKDAEKTREAQHPKHANWTALGDVGYVDDEGYLYLTDRATFMIISGGVNIYPQEIEDAMIMHDKVADVAVIGVPNAEMGEEVKAIVQPADGVQPDEDLAEELLGYARERIAHYKCPKSVDFRDELPRLPTGKLYKRLLKDEYWGKTGSRIV